MIGGSAVKLLSEHTRTSKQSMLLTVQTPLGCAHASLSHFLRLADSHFEFPVRLPVELVCPDETRPLLLARHEQGHIRRYALVLLQKDHVPDFDLRAGRAPRLWAGEVVLRRLATGGFGVVEGR